MICAWTTIASTRNEEAYIHVHVCACICTCMCNVHVHVHVCEIACSYTCTCMYYSISRNEHQAWHSLVVVVTSWRRVRARCRRCVRRATSSTRNCVESGETLSHARVCDVCACIRSCFLIFLMSQIFISASVFIRTSSQWENYSLKRSFIYSLNYCAFTAVNMMP